MLRLTAENIDLTSEYIEGELNAPRLEHEEILRVRLQCEEILLRLQEHFGEETEYQCSSRKFLGKRSVRIRVTENAFDPLSESEDDDMRLLSRMRRNDGKQPVWVYKNGENLIDIPIYRERKVSTTMQMIIAIVAAIALGLLGGLLPEHVQNVISGDILTPLYGTMMGIISAVAGPLIFLSLLWAVCNLGDMDTLSKIGRKLLSAFGFYSVLYTLICCGCGVLIFHSKGTGSTDFNFKEIYQMLLDIIPHNLFSPFVEGNSLQIITIAVVMGLVLLVLGSKVTLVVSFVEQLNTVMSLLMQIISRFLPVMVFVGLFQLVLDMQIATIARAYKLLLFMVIMTLLYEGGLTLFTAIRCKVSPLKVFTKIFPVALIGLATSSSASALGVNLDTMENKAGVSSNMTGFGVPLGQALFHNGGVILFSSLAFGFAEIYGVAITPSWILLTGILSVLLSVASPPVPGGTLTSFTVLFTRLGIPEEALALAVALNVFLDFLSTAINLYDLDLVVLNVAHKMKLLDRDKLSA